MAATEPGARLPAAGGPKLVSLPSPTPDTSRWRRHRVALVCDPRFAGGTSSWVAADLRALAPHMRLRVAALETAMFRGRTPHQAIAEAAQDCGIPIDWNPAVIRADTIVLYNPSCLRYGLRAPVRMSCAQALVVTLENFLRPGGAEGHDVAACLDTIEAALVAGSRQLAPVSPHNRRTVGDWLAARDRGWPVTADDWLPVFELPLVPPTRTPRDRRGRHSRAGFEKFPALATMLAHFPEHAEHCTILGGDSYLLDPEMVPAHWRLLRFGAVDVDEFLADIDFFVYFTHPLWRESFGRVIPEAIAAGKLVITDPGTAEAFGDAVVASDGSDVDAIVARYVARPDAYVAFVEAAQRRLADFAPAAFVDRVQAFFRQAAA